MEFIYRSAFVIGITLLVPVMMQYLTAKSKEDDTAVYTVQMRTNMMKILKIMVIICTPLGVMAAVAFFAFLSSKDWANMCCTAVVIFISIADFGMWKHYKDNKIIVLDGKKIKVIKGRKSNILLRSRITYRKINGSKIKLYDKDKPIFTITRQFDNFENLEIWLKNAEPEECPVAQ